jgi:hypothetical protein
VIEASLFEQGYLSMHAFNPFHADVVNKRHLGLAPKLYFCDLTEKTEVIGLSDLLTLFINLGCLYCKQTHRAFNVFKKHTKLIENRFSRSKVIQNSIDQSVELLTRRWNAWH